MPCHSQIYMMEGRTAGQRKVVIEKVTQALGEALGAPWGIAGVSAKDLGGRLLHGGIAGQCAHRATPMDRR